MAGTHRLSDSIAVQKILDYTATGTTPITSDAIDTRGYAGVLIITSLGTAAAGNLIKLQASSDDAAADAYDDLEGTSLSSGASDEDLWVDLFRPLKRYVKAVVTRGTTTVIEGMWAIKYGASAAPQDNTTTGTIAGEAHTSPAEGTA